jgi:hypothetical protein
MWSNDGSSWNLATGVPAGIRVQAFAASPTAWIAVGSSAGGDAAAFATTIGLRSTDGKAWTATAFPTASYRWGALYNGTIFVATHATAAGTPVINLSTDDGATWTDRTLSATLGGGPALVGYNGSRLLTPDFNTTVWFSDDNFSTFSTNFTMPGSINPDRQGIAPWSGSVWLFCDQTGPTTLRTANGSVWASATTVNMGGANHVAFGSGTFSLLQQAFYTAPADGTSITFRGTLGRAYADNIFDGTKFMAIATGGWIATSTDGGLSFTEAQILPTDGVWRAIAHKDGGYY